MEYFMKKLDKKVVFLVVTLVSIILAFAWSEVFIAVAGVVLAGLAVLILKEDKKPEEELPNWPFTTTEPVVPPVVIEPPVAVEVPVEVPEPVVEAPVEIQAPKKRGRKPKNAA